MRDEVGRCRARRPGRRRAAGHAALDLRAGVRAQLLAAGVADDRGRPVVHAPRSPDLYSHRRDGVTGPLRRPGLAHVSAGRDRRRRRRRAGRHLAAAVERPRSPRPASAAGREPAELTLVASHQDVPGQPTCARLAGLGVRDVGENRDQEAAAKVGSAAGRRRHRSALALRRAAADQQGGARSPARRRRPLGGPGAAGRRARQGRRATPAGGCAAWCRSTSRAPTAARRRGRPPACRRSPTRSRPPRRLDLAGVMAVAPLGGDPDEAFARLAQVPPPYAVSTPGDRRVGRHERRPGGRGRGAARHTCASARALLGSRPLLG